MRIPEHYSGLWQAIMSYENRGGGGSMRVYKVSRVAMLIYGDLWQSINFIVYYHGL